MQTNPEGTWCPSSLEGACKFVLPVQLSRSKIICKEIKANTKTNAFFPCASSLHHFPVHQRAQQFPTPHPLKPSQNFVKTHYNIRCWYKCGSKIIQAFPSCVGTQHVRESSLFRTGHIPVDISFVPSRVQQNCSPVHPGVLKPPWFPNERGLHMVGRFSTRVMYSQYIPICGGGTHIWLHCNHW